MPDAGDFKKYLATEIFSEQRTISYRNASRALKVHVNAAKCMLFEFHEHENKKKPNTVHATYLLAGTKKKTNTTPVINGQSNVAQDDDDEPMPPSSPPPFTSSMLEPSEHGSQAEAEERLEIPVIAITLVREEALEDIKQQYEKITSIHIYSLSPHIIQDLVALTDISRGLYTDVFAREDPLVHNKIYGVIQNSEVRRRKGRRPIVPEAPAPKFNVVKDEPKMAPTAPKTLFHPAAKKEEPTRPGSSGSTTSATTTSSNRQPALKRDASDFFKKSFGAIKPKPKLERQGTDASTNASASGTEDAKMTDVEGVEEGESEDDALFLDTGTKKAGTKKRTSEVKKERDDKAAKLRKMMDSDEEDAVPIVEDASGIKEDPVATKPGGAAGEDGEDADLAWSDSDTEKQPKQALDKDNSASLKNGSQASAGTNDEPKRRRGRRKVMRKKTMKDEDGYLVTKEEAAWESFSEEEPGPPKTNAYSGGTGRGKSSASGGKVGKGSAAKGGGNIMNFFGKKS